MKTLKQIFSAGVVVSAMFAAAPSFAATMPITWDFGGSTLENKTSITFTSGGHTVVARAYASSGNDGSGTLTAARVNRYGAGLGVSNCVNSNESCSSSPTDPDHAIDTAGKNDFLLLEFDSFVNVNDFSIGWPSESGTARPDIQLWMGPNLGAAGNADNPGLNLTGACLSGCGTTLSSLGFTAVGPYLDVAAGAKKSVTSPNPTRYMVVSGALNSGDNDYFKFKTVTTSSPVSEPGTVALFGLGMLSLLAYRRKKSV